MFIALLAVYVTLMNSVIIYDETNLINLVEIVQISTMIGRKI